VLDPADPAAIATRELNIGFFSRMVRKTPWVRMKIAASLDGKTALNNGSSQWITSDAARASAVLTGIGTVLADNPRLDVRLVDTPRQPHLVVVDSRLEAHWYQFYTMGALIAINGDIPNGKRKYKKSAR
jgi:diaminohydroxyphosphoribosylaminopyrimidine deaminase/5-amino-6-(5-phosphoribosylamino)uracil reductase